MATLLYLAAAVFGVLSILLYAPVKQTVLILGVTRPLDTWQNIHGLETHVIPDTVSCEDLHYHEPSGVIYSACAGDLERMAGWFPAASSFGHPENPSYGSLVVINPKTMKSQKLTLEGFEGPFVTHGIGIYTAPSDAKTVYIFAVNHLPNARWTAGSSEPKAASRIEVFTHTVGSSAARHLRSVAHPLIQTPNDVLPLSEREFLVTNDHVFRDGALRIAEELVGYPRTTTLHVRLGDGADDVEATVALASINNNNGLGWGPDRQVLVSSAAGGRIYFAALERAGDNATAPARLAVSHWAQADTVVDNPTFFADPYAGADGVDYSGYLLPAIARVHEFVDHFRDPTGRAPLPSIISYLPARGGQKPAKGAAAPRPRFLFSDDGRLLRGATTAVLVPIDPAESGGKRQGWLFVTGVIAPHMVATRIDFATALA
ncbi:calcium-dependent phosphotriesterase [Durotheca rogersii]|uniref:calcium-dependent phosphotriesterase n=1 Tax=Durotheca rogersii TaxID=419775 RepID=UPI00221FA43D|nr:calcium-dependent phosphotriesterase [Durotheca rogersii]KAI5866340.1 calcium-dependent phosphotriesterase [Durotheca rogersii]